MPILTTRNLPAGTADHLTALTEAEIAEIEDTPIFDEAAEIDTVTETLLARAEAYTEMAREAHLEDTPPTRDIQVGDTVRITNSSVFATGWRIGDLAIVEVVGTPYLNADTHQTITNYTISIGGVQQYCSSLNVELYQATTETTTTGTVTEPAIVAVPIPARVVSRNSLRVGTRAYYKSYYGEVENNARTVYVVTAIEPYQVQLIEEVSLCRHHITRRHWNSNFEVIPGDTVPTTPPVKEDINCDDWVKVIKNIDASSRYGLLGQIGQVVWKSSYKRNYMYSVQFNDEIANGSLHMSEDNQYENCYNFPLGHLEKVPKPKDAVSVNELEQKYKDMGMTIETYDRQTFYCLPMVYAPKYLKHHHSDMESYIIPDYYRDLLRTDVIAAIQRVKSGNSLMYMNSTDGKTGFVQYHGGGNHKFASFCTGNLLIRVLNPSQAVDCRDRLQKMMETISYDNPPIKVCKGIHIRDIVAVSFIPVHSTAFSSTGGLPTYDKEFQTAKERVEQLDTLVQDTRRKLKEIEDAEAKRVIQSPEST